MWTVLRMVKGKGALERMQSILEGAGIMMKIRAVYKKAQDSQNYYELLVLPSETEAANEALMEQGM